MLDSFSQLAFPVQALIATLFTWALTSLGACVVFFMRQPNRNVMDAMLGLAGGVMVAAAFWSLLSPSIDMSASLGMNPWLTALIGFMGGGVLLFLGDRLFTRFSERRALLRREDSGRKAGFKRCAMLVFSITLHNIPEGMAVGVVYAGYLSGSAQITAAGALALSLGIAIQNFPEGIIISPGPGKPSEAHLSHALLDRFAGEIPILGVCLGHQVIVEKYDGRVEKGARPMHGKVTPIINTGEGIFRGLPEKFSVTRYHSLVAKGELPSCLKVTARSEDGAVMAVEHTGFPVYGVQFHPEAVLSEYGHELLENFVKIAEEWREEHAVTKSA